MTPNSFSQEEILKIIVKAGHPLRLDDVLQRADLSRSSKREVLTILKDFVEDGKILRLSGGRYGVPQISSYITGTLSVQRSGVGFVAPQNVEGAPVRDIFINASDFGEAWNGDLVEVLLLSKRNVIRSGSQVRSGRQEGRIVRVIDRKHKNITVLIKEVQPNFIKGKETDQTVLATPTDPRLNFDILVDYSDLTDLKGSAESNVSSFAKGDILLVHVERRIPRFSNKTSNGQDGDYENNRDSKHDNEYADERRGGKGGQRDSQGKNQGKNQGRGQKEDQSLWAATALKHMGRYDQVKLQEDMTKLSHDIPTFFPDDVLQEARKIAQEHGFIAETPLAKFTDITSVTDITDITGDATSVIIDDSLQGTHTKASKQTKSIAEVNNANLLDLRKMPLVTIDGADAKDFDDAIFVEKEANLWHLVVAIADVSHFVRPGSKMDEEAQKRANSYYFPSSVEPMLPQELSNGLCSLRPDEEHHVMVAEMYFNAKGVCERTNFAQGLMRSHARLTYDQVQEFYDKHDHKNLRQCATNSQNANSQNTNSQDSQKDSISLSPVISTMLLESRELANILIERRKKDGGLHLEIAEPSCTIVDNKIIDMHSRPHCFSHELIEAFMVAANEAVATFLTNKKIPCLYRVHPSPAPERIQTLFTTLRHTSLVSTLPYPDKKEQEKWLTLLLQALSDKKEKAVGQEEQSFTKGKSSAEGKPSNERESSSERKAPVNKESFDNKESSSDRESSDEGESSLIQRMIVRSMMQARYSPELDQHFGLASSAYSHFTSPIRRYADLEVHRALKVALGLEKNKISVEELEKVADFCNTRERVAQVAEREVYRRMACLFLEDSVGETFSGIISHVSSFGLFVELSPSMAEGFIAISELGDDYFAFNEEDNTIIGTRTNTLFRLGSSLSVVIKSVSLEHLEIKLEPANMIKSSHRKPSGNRHGRQRDNRQQDKPKGTRQGTQQEKHADKSGDRRTEKQGEKKDTSPYQKSKRSRKSR